MWREPLTPREKVEPSLNDLLRQAVETMKSWTPEQREAHFEAQKKAWVAAEMAFGDEGTRVVTALASGSGDHAPAAWRVKDFADGWIVCGSEQTAADLAVAMSGATVQPLYGPELLAENAALRAEVSQANANGASHWSRATEAERKLAEAVGLLKDARQATGPHAEDLAVLVRIDAFLSKEAERG